MSVALAVRPPSTGPKDIDSIVSNSIDPIVRKIDQDGLYPEDPLRELGVSGAFSRHASQAPSTGLPAAVADMATISESCMSTGFCTWCQDALVWYLAASENTGLQKRLLDQVAGGEQLGGTGLSNPMKSFSSIETLALKGKKVAGGYKVTGRLPWVSNIGPGHIFAAIFELPDSRRVMAVVDADAEGVKLSRSSEFIALEGTGTYTVLFKDALISESDVIAENAAEFVPKIRQGFVLLQFGMGLGLARGVAKSMVKQVASAKNAQWLPLTPDAIFDRVFALETKVAELAGSAADTGRDAFLNVLRARLQVAELAMSAAQAGALQAGAGGYIVGSEPNRRQREALFMGILTPSVKHITMELARG
jgi:alkylation response protein AidB-like acyl-CoA dehydrogenase